MYYEDKLGRVYYEVHGPENAPAIVLSHGVGMDHTTFDAQVAALHHRYRVVTWDMPYHGLSSPIDYKLQFSAVSADLAAGMMDALQIDSAVHVGQSLGSFVVQHVAHRHPGRVKATVHIGGQPLYPRSSRLLKMVNPFIPLVLALYPGRSLYKAFATHRALRPETQAHLIETATRTGKRVIAHLTREMLRDMVRGVPEPTSKPMLLCYGDHEMSFVKRMSQKWHRRTANSQLAVVNNAHHIANKDNSGEFNMLLLHFLKNTLGGRSD